MSIQQNQFTTMNNQHPVLTGSPDHLKNVNNLQSTGPSLGSTKYQTQLSNKAEASCQVTQADFPPDLITSTNSSSKNRQLGNSSLIVCYDSDDETMLKKRHKSSSRSSSKSRNKHRTGAYSKEDIRDQYCINQKELQAFEEFSKNRLFGCLSTGNLLNLNFTTSNLAHQTPSYLLGVPNQKVQSKDSNRTIARYADISDSETSSDYGCRNSLSFLSCIRKPVRISKHYQRPLDPKFFQQQSDDDFGFKQQRLPIRPPRTCTIKANPNKTVSSISVMMADQPPSSQFQSAYHLHAQQIPNSVNLINYQNMLRTANSNFLDNLQQNLNQLNFANKSAVYAANSKSADELNDLDSDQQAANKTKHVSFELVRSNTISANLAQQVLLNERLINADVTQLPIRAGLISTANLQQQQQTVPSQAYSIQQPSYISLMPSNYVQLQSTTSSEQQPINQPQINAAQLAHHHLLAQQQLAQQSSIPPQPPIRSIHKKVVMKTQSTQTENSIFYSSHQSRSRSSSRSRFRDNILTDNNLLLDDGTYLIEESLEPSESEYSTIFDQHQIKNRRSSFELPDYLTLSPRSSSKHRSKRKQMHTKDFSTKKSNKHQLLLNYQKIQNQLEDSDDPLDELNILSKLSHLDREQRSLKSGHLIGYKPHIHATPVANLTQSLIQNVKLSQQQQQYAETATKHRTKLRKSLGDVELGLLSFEHDLSEPILSVRELNQTNLLIDNQLKQFNKMKSNSVDLMNENQLINDKIVNKIDKYENIIDEKLSLNLSPPEAFQDKKFESSTFDEVDRKEIDLEQNKKVEKTDEIPIVVEKVAKDEKLPITDEERTSTTPNEESSIKQTTVIDQYDNFKFLSEKSSTNTSLTDNLISDGKEEVKEKEISIEEKVKSKEDESIQLETVLPEMQPEKEIEQDSFKEIESVRVSLENELIKQLSDELDDNENLVESEKSNSLLNQIDEIQTKDEELKIEQTIQKKEMSIESLLTQQLAEKAINEDESKLVKHDTLEEVSEDEELEEEQENEEDPNLAKVVDLTGGVYLRRNQSSELSTVSEVSEEISLGLNDETYSLKKSKTSSSKASVSKSTSSKSSSSTKSSKHEKQIVESDEKWDKNQNDETTESSTSTSHDVNLDELNDEDHSTTELSDKEEEKSDKKIENLKSTSTTSSSPASSFENLPIPDEQTDKDESNKEELSLSKSLSQELNNELNKKLENLHLESYEQEPKVVATPIDKLVLQSNLTQLKKCLDSDEFDPRIYRTFSVSIEETFDLEQRQSVESSGTKKDQIEDSISNFSNVFGQTITLDKETSSKEASLSEKSCSKSSSSTKSSKSIRSKPKTKSSSSSSSSSSSKTSSSSTSISTSSKSTSKKKAKSQTPSSQITTSTNDYKLLSDVNTENTMDNCSQCAAELAALKQQPILINLVEETQQIDSKKEHEIDMKHPEINNLISKPKQSSGVIIKNAGLLTPEPAQLEGASNDALAVLNQNLETAGESSQATEQDVCGFSFGQQSSQDLADEDSLCLIQSIHATGSQPLSSSTNDNNKLSSTKSSHSLKNQKLIGKKQKSTSSSLLDKKRQSESAFNQSTSSSSLKNGVGNQLQQPQSELKTIESEECLKEESLKEQFENGNLELEKYTFDESSSISQVSLPPETNRVRNLLQRFENRPVSFAGEPIEFGKESRRSSQSSGKTIFAKRFGPKSHSIDLFNLDDSLIGNTNINSSNDDSKEEEKSEKQQSTDEQVKEQSLDNLDEQISSPSEQISSPSEQNLRKLSKKSSTSSVKSDKSGKSSSLKSSKTSSSKSSKSKSSSKRLIKDDILVKKRSDEEELSSLSSIEKLKSVGDESISELISEVSSSDIQKDETTEKTVEDEKKTEEFSVSSKSSTKTTKESSEPAKTEEQKETTQELDNNRTTATTLSNDESSNIVKNIEKITDESELKIEQKLEHQTTTDTSNVTSSSTTDYSELKIRQHDEALRQKQQLLQQNHSIKRKLLTQLSTSGLAMQTNEKEELEKTVEKSVRSSSQDDVLSIGDDEERIDQSDKAKSSISNKEQAVCKLSKTQQSLTDDNLSKSSKDQKMIEPKKDKKSTITNLPVYYSISKPTATNKVAKVNTLIIDELDEDMGIHSQPYTNGSWFYVTHQDELAVWGHKLEARKEQTTQSTDIGSTLSGSTLKDEQTTKEEKKSKSSVKDRQTKYIKIDKEDSSLSQDLSTGFADNVDEQEDLGISEQQQLVSIAESEKSFRRHFQSITHRMIHRRASMELYKRIMNNTFVIDKNVTISRVNNEFGFRIHGSKPVVVSAIEKDTAAEDCGLEIGDIIVTINDLNVLDFMHSDVVRLAHSGLVSLRLGLLNTGKVVRKILNSASSSTISSSTEQTLTVTTTCESQTTSSITVTNSETLSSKHKEQNQSYESDEDDHTLSCRTVTCSSSILTSSLDYNTASKVLLTGYLRKARALDENYHNIEADKWRLRLFKLRIDGTLHWFQYRNQTVDPLGIISLKGTYCKLINIDHHPVEQKNEPETKSIIFAIIRNKTDKIMHYFKCENSMETAQKWINMLNLIAKQVTSVNLYIERTLKYTHTSQVIRNPDCVGYLGKKSAKTGHYQQRYFILKDGCLYFYLEIASNITIGVFYLQGYKVQSSSDNNKKYCITLSPINPQHKLICLAADTEIDKKRWLSALEYSIDRWIKLA